MPAQALERRFRFSRDVSTKSRSCSCSSFVRRPSARLSNEESSREDGVMESESTSFSSSSSSSLLLFLMSCDACFRGRASARSLLLFAFLGVEGTTLESERESFC